MVAALHPDHVAAQTHMTQHKKMWESVLAAEKFVQNPQNRASNKAVVRAVQERLDDIAWNELQLGRELYLECMRSGWDVTNESLRRATWTLFASPANTKYDLEDLFAHLSAVSKQSSKSTPMSKTLDIDLFDCFV